MVSISLVHHLFSPKISCSNGKNPINLKKKQKKLLTYSTYQSNLSFDVDLQLSFKAFDKNQNIFRINKDEILIYEIESSI